MPTTINDQEFPHRPRETTSRVAAGDEVIVNDGPTPRARRGPLAPDQPRVEGLHAGAIEPAPDFDATLPDDLWLGQI
jgi:antitoxin (DNA-binding transcriptional repressor) of toxin-antitoxin stability system